MEAGFCPDSTVPIFISGQNWRYDGDMDRWQLSNILEAVEFRGQRRPEDNNRLVNRGELEAEMMAQDPKGQFGRVSSVPFRYLSRIVAGRVRKVESPSIDLALLSHVCPQRSPYYCSLSLHTL